MDFSKYNEMPVKADNKENLWFHMHIKNLSFNNNVLIIDKEYVVKINQTNSNIIENDINNNESYNAEFTKKIFNYYSLVNNGKFPQVGEEARTPITDLIRMIDLENSTNIWRYKDKRPFLKNMVEFIITKYNNFWNRLERGDIALVDDLRIASKATTDGPKSLASKICKYFSEIFFNKDNYYINDTVVRHVLPYYLEYYGIDKEEKTKTYFEKLSYQKLFDYIDKIRNKACSSLTKSNVDHIMWYCYRFETTKEE